MKSAAALSVVSLHQTKIPGGSMKCIRIAPLAAVIASLLIGVPSGIAQSEPTISNPTVRLTISPNKSSVVSMKTLPQATCVLHAEGDNAAEHSFKIFADDEGTIRFHVNPSAESDQA